MRWALGTGGGSDDEASNDYRVRGCRPARRRRCHHHEVAHILDQRHRRRFRPNVAARRCDRRERPTGCGLQRPLVSDIGLARFRADIATAVALAARQPRLDIGPEAAMRGRFCMRAVIGRVQQHDHDGHQRSRNSKGTQHWIHKFPATGVTKDEEAPGDRFRGLPGPSNLGTSASRTTSLLRYRRPIMCGMWQR